MREFLDTLTLDLNSSYVLANQAISIWVPPLRRRKDGDDIAALTGHFLRQFATETQQVVSIDENALNMIVNMEFDYENVRELRSRIMALANEASKNKKDCRIRKTHIDKLLAQLSRVPHVQQIKQVFVSYSRQDWDFVQRFINGLESDRLDFWIDTERIPVGTEFWDRDVQQGLEGSESMLLVVSPESMRSKEIAREINYFLDKDRPILLLIYREADIPYRLAPIQRVQYSALTRQQVIRTVTETLEHL